ncbi:MAG: signal recognition particle-docking protein FtsY [Armatimonadota bacterium]
MLRNLFRRVTDLLTGTTPVTDQLFDELEEMLILSDVSARIASDTVALVKQAARDRGVRTADGVRDLLRAHIAGLLDEHAAPLEDNAPTPPLFCLVVGVNGTGKTTTIAKIAARFQRQGRRVMLAAGDTFRAAAIDQLAVWANRLKAELVRSQPGGDPAAVMFDSIQAARARGIDVVIADTAGRLHTQHNLMEELRKCDRVVRRELGRAPDETLLVLDATTGQNALVQSQVFREAVGITGLVMTKLDGTAKGGTLITVAHELGLPVKLIGVGEKLDDLKDFDPQEYAAELLP